MATDLVGDLVGQFVEDLVGHFNLVGPFGGPVPGLGIMEAKCSSD